MSFPHSAAKGPKKVCSCIDQRAQFLDLTLVPLAHQLPASSIMRSRCCRNQMSFQLKPGAYLIGGEVFFVVGTEAVGACDLAVMTGTFLNRSKMAAKRNRPCACSLECKWQIFTYQSGRHVRRRRRSLVPRLASCLCGDRRRCCSQPQGITHAMPASDKDAASVPN